jgi:hypothetical protein
MVHGDERRFIDEGMFVPLPQFGMRYIRVAVSEALRKSISSTFLRRHARPM